MFPVDNTQKNEDYVKFTKGICKDRILLLERSHLSQQCFFAAFFSDNTVAIFREFGHITIFDHVQ